MHLHNVVHAAHFTSPTAEGEFEQLYRAQWAPMVRLAWLLIGNWEDAEDVVHDAFCRMEPRLDSIEDRNAYLRVTVINSVRALHRRRGVERRRLPEPMSSHCDPETEEIWELVKRLPPRQRQALVLHFYLDLSIEDTAALLRCPLGTAKSLIYRGVERLRKRMANDN